MSPFALKSINVVFVT